MNTEAPPMVRPPSATAPWDLCSLFLLIYFIILCIFMDIPYISLIDLISICPKHVPYISFVCFVFYSVNRFSPTFLSGGRL